MSKISVVIPTRNRCGLLARSLRCALGQRGVEVEVLVADDASTDGTGGLVAGLNDSRLTLLPSARSSGPAAARNRGLARAGGDWVAFLDDDDLWAPNKLARQLQAAREADRAWVYTGAVTVQQRGARLAIVAGQPPRSPEQVQAVLPFRNAIPGGTSNIIARRELLDEVGGFDETLPQLEDWDLYIRLALAAPPAVVREPLVAYRLHRAHHSMVGDATLQSKKLIADRYAAQRKGQAADWAATHRYQAWLLLRAGNRTEAALAYCKAVRHGDLLSLARAAVALGYPPATHRSLHRRAVGPAWRAHAEAWLANLEG